MVHFELVDGTVAKDEALAAGYCRMGDSQDNRGNCEEAIEDYTEAIRLDPKDRRHAVIVLRPTWNKGDYEKAIADGTEAIRLDSRCAWGYGGRGFAYCKKRGL